LVAMHVKREHRPRDQVHDVFQRYTLASQRHADGRLDRKDGASVVGVRIDTHKGVLLFLAVLAT